MPERVSEENLQFLKSEYQNAVGMFERFCSELITQLNELLRIESVIPALPIQHRVKSWESIETKCGRYGNVPSNLAGIPDIAGLRIVLLFERDLNVVTRIIEKNLQVLHKEDTRERLGIGEFGYGSIHYEVTPPGRWLEVPTLKGLKGLKGEIQVRTASQHIWATASHILQYKRESDVPPPLRRAINRAAALLEIVDLEFERVLSERDHYIVSGPLAGDQVLNTDSLKLLLNDLWPLDNRKDDDPYSELLEDLRKFDVKTSTSLRTLINKHHEAAIAEERGIVADRQKALAEGKELIGTTEERVKKGVYFTHVGLTRNVLGNEFGDDFSVYMSKAYQKRHARAEKKSR